jgi:hypothetical protein
MLADTGSAIEEPREMLGGEIPLAGPAALARVTER